MFAIPQILLAAALACLAAFGAGRWVGVNAGIETGRAEVQEKWDDQIEAQTKALNEALLARFVAEQTLDRKLKEQSDAFSADLARADSGLAAARRELARLRAILTRPPASGGEQPASPGTRPPIDGPSTPSNLLAACAGELVEMGGVADRLASQVAGLQGYARLAYSTCGGGNVDH